MNAALYIRVSTDEQTEFSPDAQRRSLIEYAKKNSMLIDDQHIYIDEGISGTSAIKRPAFQKMIAIAKKKPSPFDVILVHKFDRFARSREDSVVYKSLLRKECGVKVISITEQLEDDKFSVILEAMLEAMAEYYSLNLSDEVMKGMTEKAMRGGVQGSAPFGYEIKDNAYFVVEEEAQVVKLIFDKIANKEWGYRQACINLLSMGIHSKNGVRWTPKRIKYMLQNPTYIGNVRWNYSTHKGGRKLNSPEDWIITAGKHEPIVAIETFNIVNKIIDETSALHTKRPISSNVKHWLAGLLRCSTCGGTLIHCIQKTNTKKNGTVRKVYYRCNAYNKGGCNTSNYVRITQIEKDVKDALKRDYEHIDKNKYSPTIVSSIKNTTEIDLITKQLERTKNKYSIAKRAYLAEIDTLEEYKETKQLIVLEEQQLHVKLESLRSESVSSNIVKEKIRTTLEFLDDTEISNEDKNIQLKTFISKIVVDKSLDTLRIYYFK